MIREELGADSQIPVRTGLTKNGKYRKELIFGTDKGKYNKRSIVEMVNSVLKRVFGEENRARTDRMRNKETKLRNVCYNVYRRVVVLSNGFVIVFEGFYRARNIYYAR